VLQVARAPDASVPQHTQAPYLTAIGEKVEHLPLDATQVDVLIAGVIADVTVKQVYQNRGTLPIEDLDKLSSVAPVLVG
jgi:Ca-activated chloride channel family protein